MKKKKPIVNAKTATKSPAATTSPAKAISKTKTKKKKKSKSGQKAAAVAAAGVSFAGLSSAGRLVPVTTRPGKKNEEVYNKNKERNKLAKANKLNQPTTTTTSPTKPKTKKPRDQKLNKKLKEENRRKRKLAAQQGDKDKDNKEGKEGKDANKQLPVPIEARVPGPNDALSSNWAVISQTVPKSTKKRKLNEEVKTTPTPELEVVPADMKPSVPAPLSDSTETTKRVSFDWNSRTVGKRVSARYCFCNSYGNTIFDETIEVTERQSQEYKAAQKKISDIIKEGIVVGYNVVEGLDLILLKHPFWDIRDLKKYKLSNNSERKEIRSLYDLASQYYSLPTELKNKIASVQEGNGDKDEEEDPELVGLEMKFSARVAFLLYRKHKKEWEESVKMNRHKKKKSKKSIDLKKLAKDAVKNSVFKGTPSKKSKVVKKFMANESNKHIAEARNISIV